MNVTCLNKKLNFFRIEQNEFVFEVTLDFYANPMNHVVEIYSIEIENSENLNDMNFEGPYPAIDEDELCLELENEFDWFESESMRMEYLQELNSEY